MRILHVYKDFDPPIHGGMERHIALMCRYQRQWADVDVLVCSRSGRTQVMDRDGQRVIEVGEWGRFQSAPLSPLFPWYMRKEKADVMVVHVPNPTAELGYLLARPKGRMVVRYHSDVVRQASAMKVYGPLQRRFLRQADLVIPTSTPYLRTSKTLQAVKERCRVVPLGILPEEFESPDMELVSKYKAEYGEGYVLFSGMHRYYKGLSYLVEAAKRIKARVVIAGDGPEREANMALARSLGVDVVFPGRLSHEELVAHLHGCNVFAFPSVERSEAFGISIMEAHACGKPVVATCLGTGVEYINAHEQTGLNVAPRDSVAFADAVNELLRKSDEREAMGQYAKERIAREFRADRVARDEFELYQRVVECKNLS